MLRTGRTVDTPSLEGYTFVDFLSTLVYSQILNEIRRCQFTVVYSAVNVPEGP